jgi:hypothetical protein
MIVRELLTKVRDKLQDTDGTYWSDSELLDLHNECKRYMASERNENPTYTNITLLDNTNVYEVDGVLRYVSAKDSTGTARELYPDDTSGDDISSAVIIRKQNEIYVNNPTDGVTLTIKHISFPEEDNLNDVIRTGDEESYRYFILSKCYEKDNDMEQFQKAQYFWGMFIGALQYSKKNSSLNFINQQEVTTSYFY